MNFEGLVERVTSGRWKTIYYENADGELFAKCCKGCGEAKTLDNFVKRGRGLGGCESMCTPCEKERTRTWYEENREKHVIMRQKWNEENRERHALLRREWYEENKERFREKNRNWSRNNPDKVALKGQRRRASKAELPNDWTSEQQSVTLEYFNGSCALTGSIDYQWDHVIPIATRHGGTTLGNMIPLRGDLNASKTDHNIFEWFEANGQRFNLEQSRFDSLIEWLGKANGMTVEEYRAYVYECHANPREINNEADAS